MTTALPRAAARGLALVPLLVSTAVAADQPAPGLPAPSLRLIDVALNVMAVGGASTAGDEDIHHGLYLGHHDPARRGFTLQQAELSLAGAVDPYFTAQAYILAGEEGFELEEAFATTSALPAGLQVRAGSYLTEFGRTNPAHAHASPWLSKPVIATRVFGADGTRGAGARLAWLAPLPVYARVLVGAQNAADETAASFAGLVDHDDETITIGGRPRDEEFAVHSVGDLLWSARAEVAFDLGATAVRLGASWMGGPNATGANVRTDIYGADLVAKWTGAGRQGWPFVQVEAEAVLREFEAAAYDDGTDIYAAETLSDRGLYAGVLWGFVQGWAAGVRGEWAEGSGESGVAGFDLESDPARDDRIRVSPLITWNPSHFSRLRLQYDYDRFDHELENGDDHAHSAWLGLEVLIGAHPAHGF